MIEFRRVTKKYGNITAVHQLSLRIESNEVCVIVGPSGCGKSTLLRSINRMVEPTSGEVAIDDKPLHSFSPELLRRGIGYVIQSIGLLPHMNVRENISIVLRLLKKSREERDQRADELLELVDLNAQIYGDKYPHQLSGGEAQRIGVARALASNPHIMLMDEPFAAVDQRNREILQKELLSLQRRLHKTIVFVTHDLDEAIRLGDKIVLMRNGRVVQHDTPERLLTAPTNEFVREFIGTDYALKRLACFAVGDYMKEALTLTKGELSKGEPTPDHPNGSRSGGMVWVHDEARKLIGTVSPKRSGSAGGTFVPLKADDVGVTPLSTLKEALSRIIGHGFRAVPVIDEDHHVLGEVCLPDIQRLNQSGFA